MLRFQKTINGLLLACQEWRKNCMSLKTYGKARIAVSLHASLCNCQACILAWDQNGNSCFAIDLQGIEA
jgi:hypothetical protein